MKMLDFSDVLIKPGISDIPLTRADINITPNGYIPIIVANMVTSGTFEVARIASKRKILTFLSKEYNIDEYLTNLMDIDIETHHHEGLEVTHAIARMADGMPAFGIVAAVMGVVHTMSSLGSVSNSELGVMIAAALVGTFLGILLGYGFVGPVATLLEQKVNESSKMLQTAKVILISSLNGYAPTIAVEFGRKVLNSTERPGFTELEDYIKGAKTR